MTDNVNSPKHYKLSADLEVIDVRRAILDKLDIEGIVIPARDIDNWSRAWEYLTRMFFKNGKEDAEKAQYYLDALVADMHERGDYKFEGFK